MKELKQYLNYLAEWIKLEVTKAHYNGVVVGLSGGIDSSVVSLLAQQAFPENHLIVIMPCHSQDFDEKYAQLLIDKHKLNSRIIDLTLIYDELIKILEFPLQKLALANIKPRLRMTTLYTMSQNYNYMVLGTENADEWYVGYFTKYGDGGVDLSPVIHLLKTEIKQAAKLLGVPSEIILRIPTAGLWKNQNDEEEMGVTYKQLDDYLQGKKVSIEIIKKIKKLHKYSEHKRNLPKIPPVVF